MTAWAVRAGKHGEREQWCLQEGYAGGGWDEVKDLSLVDSRDGVRALVEEAYPHDAAGRTANYAAQLWGLRCIREGDLVVLPLKTTSQVAIGICAGEYEYKPDAPLKHVVRVNWQRDDVPRSAIKDDLLYTLGAFLTVFRATRNQAEARLRVVMSGGTDPGSYGLSDPAPVAVPAADDELESFVVPTLETIRDRVQSFVSENFKGHALTELVAEILRVRGFVCDVSPPGADQGVDILAGSGALGLDSPTLIVEVKSEDSQVKAPIVRGLQGAMLQNRSDQGLLVAWGGITREAEREIRTDRLTMRVWSAKELLDQLFETYAQLPEDMRRRIPLKQAWVLDDEPG
ncbi:restriction endonuclease [Zhihengliuella halotolerans]|uniref:Restriction system protein n=1 Tax=Zhihengliuella halotolerans TaxID=370736 RepID=A0A4Q8AEE6_9MICC|nr:restriction endonuclease [Zhihengliuella halotolerans]RZU62657.1 restriction system protein [Zhihengliuella halotolerans]